ncbi:MAG: UMP kinase [Candidatus Sungbacteria bacterium]|nr:UMP kinase [Candidatus Sungbacteria bacterium]
MPVLQGKNKKQKLRWKRVLLKLSGETLGGQGKFGIDVHAVEYIANEIRDIFDLGCEIAIVIGGGNLIRGSRLAIAGIDRPTADTMGMLGTMINALALHSALEHVGIPTRVLSAIMSIQVAEPYTRRQAVDHLEKGRVVILAGGTGNPYFTTDTAAALRTSEIQAEVLLKATSVDGVYTSDPRTDKNAKFLRTLDPQDMLNQNLRVMDLTAATLSIESETPIIVFNVFRKGNLKRLILGQKIGSEIRSKKK